MKKTKNGKYLLNHDELHSLLLAFAKFRDILDLGIFDETYYFTNGKKACLKKHIYDACSCLHDFYLKS